LIELSKEVLKHEIYQVFEWYL